MRGFSNTEQQLLANFVRYHRRKLPQPLAKTFNSEQQRVLLLLRLSVILNRDRVDQPTVPIELHPLENGVDICAQPSWLEKNPLSTTELRAECQEWARAGMLVTLNGDA